MANEFEGWSDDEIRDFALTGKEPAKREVQRIVKEGFAKDAGKGTAADKVAEDYTRGEPAWSRAAAGFGQTVAEPFIGAAEKFELAFPGEGQAGKDTIARIAAERANRRGHLEDLRKTPAGQFGSFLGEAAPSVLGRATPLGQALVYGTKGFLTGGPDQPTGIGNELASSTASGALEAGLTAGTMQGVKAAGKALGAAKGEFTPKGQSAMDLDLAARSMGLPPLRVGQLDPSSPAGTIERNLPGYGQRVEAQADALRPHLDSTKQVPKAVGRGTEEVTVPGGALKEGMADAANTVLQQGNAKYGVVDEYLKKTGVTGVQPQYTYNTLRSIAKLTPAGKPPESNPVLGMLDHYDSTAFDWLKQGVAAGMKPKDIIAQGIPMTSYHKMRVAANRALSQMNRANPAQMTAEGFAAKRELSDLVKALDNDAERWATQNAGQREAMDLYNNAKDFYREVVAPTVLDNPVARKLTTKRTPFKSSDDLYSATLNQSNQELIDRLLPTMDVDTKNKLALMREIPDLGRTVMTKEAPRPDPRGGGLMALMKAGIAHPATLASEVAPGLSWLSQTTPAKRMYFGKNVLGQGYAGDAASALAQYPEDRASNYVRERLGMSR